MSEKTMDVDAALKQENRRIRRLDAELEWFQQVHKTCENQMRLIKERRRRRGEAAEERAMVRRESGRVWYRQYCDMVNGYLSLLRYSSEMMGDQDEASSARMKEVVDRASQRLEERRRSQPEDVDVARMISILDAEANDYAALVTGLTRAIEDAGEPTATEKAESDTILVEAKVEPLVQGDDGLLVEYMDFNVVDEFGRPLNEAATLPKNAEANAARIVYSDSRAIVFEPPSRIQRRISFPESDSLSATERGRATWRSEGGGRRAGNRSPVPATGRVYVSLDGGNKVAIQRRVRTSADARSAGELRDSGTDMADLGPAREGESTVRATESGRIRWTETSRPSNERHPHRMTLSHRGRTSQETAPKMSDESKPKPKVGDEWNESQRQRARLSAYSGGMPTPWEEETRESLTTVERRVETERVRRTEILKAGKRSLLLNLMASPASRQEDEAVRRAKSEKVCELLLEASKRNESSEEES